MLQIEIEGRRLEAAAGDTYADLLARAGLRRVLAVRHDGEIYELFRPVQGEGVVEPLRFDDPEGRTVFHHTSTHIMAQAVQRLFPGTKLAIGPADADGFFYDMLPPAPITPEQFADIEAEMRKIAAADYPLQREVLTRDEAIALFERLGEQYKLQIIERLPEEATISLYRQGDFVDLCRGPHLASTGPVRAAKLLSVAGAYWRGDESQPMLQRVYGTSFPAREQLEAHLARVEEAKRRDHRKLGRELDLFTFHDEAPGFAFWHDRGTIVYQQLEQFSREVQRSYGYQEVMTPWIFRPGLWERSGHWQHYRDDMFVIEGKDETLAAKPMNCPGHCVLFAEQVRSYRDLPLRIAEYGPLSRFERSGTLHGLMRVRGFHQDDAHVFVRQDQIQSAIREVLEIIDRIYGTLQLRYNVEVSTRPEDFMGDPEVWRTAEEALENCLREGGVDYRVNAGDGAFYGPKIDFHVVDALGRQWQCGTVQLDFQMPMRFELRYRDEHGGEQTPVMIHRAIYGSIERFLGILLEHFAGAFPTWLAPEQVRLLPVADRHIDYARAVERTLRAASIRVGVDAADQKLGYKMRQAQLAKIPYVLVVGEREVEAGRVSVRTRGQRETVEMEPGAFADAVGRELRGRDPELRAAAAR